MNAPFTVLPDAPAPFDFPPAEPGTAETFAARCEAAALAHINGEISLRDAVDELQTYAEASGLLDQIGQDEAQRLLGVAFAGVDLMPGPDHDELPAECEHEIQLRTADLVRQYELADPRDRHRHTGEAPPPVHVRNSDRGGIRTSTARPYSPPQATIDAFGYVLRLRDANATAAWLLDHPQAAPGLFQLWKASRC